MRPTDPFTGFQSCAILPDAEMDAELTFDYEPLKGAEITPYIQSLAKLRIAVFREFPYLYEGSFDYERPYLERYATSARSLIVLMKHQGEVVGATSCLPLEDELAEFRHPFERSGHDLSDYFYFGESIILPEFRGKGAGGKFFQFREDHAASFGTFQFTTFCAVERPHDHPARPSNYRPLHEFWERTGFQKQIDLQCQLDWKEHGSNDEVAHTLTFWTKAISAPHSQIPDDEDGRGSPSYFRDDHSSGEVAS